MDVAIWAGYQRTFFKDQHQMLPLNTDLQFQALGRLGMKDKSLQMCCKVLSTEMASILGGQPVNAELQNILS